jgi:glycosyltransferase involved in cell wall biosynthesis
MPFSHESPEPLVTVVIPNFNYGRFLGEALDSLVSQDFQNWEAIVVDNFSTDNSDEVVAKMQDQRIQLLKFANGGSIAAARNFGTRQARGQYIAFLDSDDFWSAKKLSESIAALAGGADLTYHHLDVVGRTSRIGKSFVRGRRLGANPLRELLTRGNAIATSSVVVSKSALEAVGNMDENPQLLGVEDYDAWLKIAANGGSFELIRKNLGTYRIHESSNSKKKMAHKVRLVVDKHLTNLSAKDQFRAEAVLRYVDAREDFVANSVSLETKRKLVFALLGGPFDLKVRSAYMLAISIIRGSK